VLSVADPTIDEAAVSLRSSSTTTTPPMSTYPTSTQSSHPSLLPSSRRLQVR